MVTFVLLIVALGFCSVSGNSQIDKDQPLYRSGGFALASQQNGNPFEDIGFLVAIQRNEASDLKQQQNQIKLQKFKPIQGIKMIKEETRRAQPDNNPEDDDLANRRLLLEYKGPYLGAPNSQIPLVNCRRSNIEAVLEENAQIEKPEKNQFVEMNKEAPGNENEKLITKIEQEDLSEFGNGRRFAVIPGPRATESTNPEEVTTDSQTNLVLTSNQDKKGCKDDILTNNRRANDELEDPYVDYDYTKKNNENKNQLIKNEKSSSKLSPKSDDGQVKSRSGNQQKVMLIENTKVCYACSTASNPNCLVPNRRTTVKYCRKGHDTCIIKLFDTKEGTVLTRDCGSSCSDNVIPGVTPPYTKCSVCHEDLCNSAFSLNKQNLIFLCFMFFFTVIKSAL